MTNILYWFYNSSSSGGVNTPPPSTVVVTNLQTLVRIVGSPASPVVGVTLAGIGLRDTAYQYMEPHGMPSGGDWALRRDGAVFIEGSVGTVVDGCVLERLDGNAVVISGFNRGVGVTRNEFAWIGDTAIVSWGYTTSADPTYRALAPGMGEDGTAGEQPWGNNISFNFVREIGINEKQSSFHFQAVTTGNHVEGNVAFNGPRASINVSFSACVKRACLSPDLHINSNSPTPYTFHRYSSMTASKVAITLLATSSLTCAGELHFLTSLFDWLRICSPFPLFLFFFLTPHVTPHLPIFILWKNRESSDHGAYLCVCVRGIFKTNNTLPILIQHSHPTHSPNRSIQLLGQASVHLERGGGWGWGDHLNQGSGQH